MFFEIKEGNLRLQFGQRQFVHFVIVVIFTFLSFSQNSAQPRNGGCGKGCQEARRKLVELRNVEILKLTETLKIKPDNVDLYYQRGQIYFGIIFEIKGNIYHLNPDRKAYYFDVIAKALADFTKVINLSPKAEYYEKRGRIYTYLWRGEASEFDSRRYDPQISDEKSLEKIYKIFLNNDNFNAAEADFLTAVKLSSDNVSSLSLFHQPLANLRISRADYLGRMSDKYTLSLIKNTKTADIILDDINFYIEVTKKYENPDWRKSILRLNLILKAEIAGNLGRDDIALEALNEATKFLDETKSGLCSIYGMRAKFNFDNQKYDLVIQDVNLATELDSWNCISLIEIRGDSYKNRGNIKNAIDDYSAVIDSKRWSSDVRVYRKRGNIYLQLKDFNRAVLDFTNVIRNGSICPQDYNLRAKVYRLIGNEKEALEDEKIALTFLKRLDENQQSACSEHSYK